MTAATQYLPSADPSHVLSPQLCVVSSTSVAAQLVPGKAERVRETVVPPVQLGVQLLHADLQAAVK